MTNYINHSGRDVLRKAKGAFKLDSLDRIWTTRVKVATAHLSNEKALKELE